MPQFYHYTDDEGAKNIIRSGRIMASLSHEASNVAGFGNGVYLTTLEPETNTKAQISKNNWNQTSESFLKKTDNYFVLNIPKSAVRAITSDRDIYLFSNGMDLRLKKYSWWLKKYDSNQILSSYKYKLDSMGPASTVPALVPYLGDYTMSEETVNGRIVYEHETSEKFLFMSSCGKWLVGPLTCPDAGKYMAAFLQRSKYKLGPDSNLPFEYCALGQNQNLFKKDDSTLKAHPYQV